MGVLLNEDGKRPCVFTGKGKYSTPWSIADKTAKAQLKKVVDLLRTCEGELVSVNNEPFIVTFSMPAEKWQAIQKEVE